MDKILAILYFVVGLIVVVSTFPEGNTAVLLLIVCVLIVNLIIRRSSENTLFLQKLFMVGLLLRVSLGTIIHVFELRDVTGPDSFMYDEMGSRIADIWLGNIHTYSDAYSQNALGMTGAGWGMKYFVAFIYSITGRNILAAQFCSAMDSGARKPFSRISDVVRVIIQMKVNSNSNNRGRWYCSI
ncbi:hypothetical protein BH24ACI2_BH24ACI2_02020 [soil metagenome]|jgi:hypothetical protein|nr:hypothetical protein [Acidobacteriota bacterium]